MILLFVSACRTMALDHQSYSHDKKLALHMKINPKKETNFNCTPPVQPLNDLLVILYRLGCTKFYVQTKLYVQTGLYNVYIPFRIKCYLGYWLLSEFDNKLF